MGKNKGLIEWPIATAIAIICFVYQQYGRLYFISKGEAADLIVKSIKPEIQRDPAFRAIEFGEAHLVRESMSKMTGYLDAKIGQRQFQIQVELMIDYDGYIANHKYPIPVVE